MHKIVLKLFVATRNFLDFLKVLTVFTILLMIIYWIQNILNPTEAYLGFVTPFLDFFVYLGNNISDGSLQIHNAVYEYKYLNAILLLTGIFYGMFLLNTFVDVLEEVYENIRKRIKRKKEEEFNAELQRDLELSQLRLKKYELYIAIEENEEKNKLNQEGNTAPEPEEIIKVLSEQVDVEPKNYQSGYLYSFEQFGKVDIILSYISFLIKKYGNLSFVVCLQISTGDKKIDEEQIKSLINLKLTNKICALGDTVYRYSFNRINRYKALSIGVFQSGSETFEVYEFIENE